MAKKIISLFEIFLLITASFAFSYIIYEASGNLENIKANNKSSYVDVLFSFYKLFVKYIIGNKGMVSAEGLSVNTCLISKNASICQEYASEAKCQNECGSGCIPSSRNQISQCKLGTCYDNIEGTCQPKSPRQACESGNGRWFDDENGNIPECQRGCCVLGDQAFFATEQECRRTSSQYGIKGDFKAEVNTELACLVLAKSQEEGACVYNSEFENTCKFTTKANCIAMNGDFKFGYLCSNPELKTNCIKQASVKCAEGKDGVYWFDSCGNPENIYDSNTVKSYNDGKLLSYNESCSLGNGGNALANQANCGNCNYLLGSRCGAKTGTEKLADSTKDFVCKDLRCRDSNGKIRLNGESWCAYNGAIGTDSGSGDFLRSIDTPGSRHFRQTCIDGNVRTEPCADYRNEICVEAQSPITNGKTFSSAACRLNQWQLCIDYNKRAEDEEDLTDKCKKNVDCFIKEINIADNFQFNICAPKYPAGFDLSENGKGAQTICRLANQKCTVVFVKDWGGWECKANCGCLEQKFSEQMNDFCMSLGDCGASVNYQGSYTQNYKIASTDEMPPDISTNYINGLKNYATPVRGKFAEPGAVSGEIGIPEGLGTASAENGEGMGMMPGMIAGGLGVALVYAASAGYLSGTFLSNGVSTALPALIAPEEAGGGVVFAAESPGLSAFGGALAGAAIGFAVVSMLISFLVPGMDESTALALSAAGAVAGGMIGYSLMGGQYAAVLGPIGWVVLAIVVIIIIIAAIFGIGKTREVTITFSCNPWQAPTGGAKCNQCGKDSGNGFDGKGLPCSKYACESLGQTCEFINEGTSQEICYDMNPNDASPPRIKPLQSALQPGFSYADENDNGVKVKSSENEGCVKAYSPLSFGIGLDEPGQCKMDIKHADTFENMQFDFGDDNLFTYNHSMIFSVPSLESLGLPGYDPNRRADYSLYVRCQDKAGNKNVNEYVINFCVKPGDDFTAPIITGRLPVNANIKYGLEILNASVYTNEPSECKWDSVDKEYDIMENSMACDNDIRHQTLNGWKCDTQLPISGNQDQIFYIRCKDQPWLIEDSGTGHSTIVVNDGKNADGTDIIRNIEAGSNKHRNKNTESYQFAVIKSLSELKIDSISPDDRTLTYGIEPVSVTVEAKTSGGANGNAKCSFLSNGQYIEFLNTLSNVHTQTFESFSSGEKEIKVKCQDIAGNTAEATANFNIEIDNDAPDIARVYAQAGNLNIVTNEQSQCYASTSSCSFDIANSTALSGSEIVHSMSFSLGSVHYIKCKDRFGNVQGDCSMAVRGVQ